MIIYHLDEVFRVLNKKSGLLGLSGRTRDMRDLLSAGPDDEAAALAVDVFCYRLKKYIMGYLGVLAGHAVQGLSNAQDTPTPRDTLTAQDTPTAQDAPGGLPAHAVIFTGGIGENAGPIRRKATEGLEYFGLELDENLNELGLGEEDAVVVSSESSPIKVVVVATDEERYIAERVHVVLGEK